MPSEAFIQCENLIKIYRLEAEHGHDSDSAEVQALQGLDLVVMKGEMVGVVGASGSGKSTLLNILGGLDRPTAGKVIVDQKDLAHLSQARLDQYRRDTVGFVWQQGSRNLIPYLTALENVQLPLTLSGRVDAESAHQPGELLKLVGLSDRAGHRLEELSGGEQQRVAIAIALANHPRLLLADEPTGELDTATAQTIYDLLRSLNQKLELTVVIVSHDTSLARQVDRVVAVRDGKLASELIRKPAGSEDKHHIEEYLVLDSAGRLQIPRELLQQFHIQRRVRLEAVEDGILIRPPENEHLPVEPTSTGVSESGLKEGAPELERLPEWMVKTWEIALRLYASLRERWKAFRKGGRGSRERDA